MVCAYPQKECVAVTINKPVVPKLRLSSTQAGCTNAWRTAVTAMIPLRCGEGTLCDINIEASFLAATNETERKEDWIGFSHTTFEDKFGPVNAKRLFETESFRKSLPLCKGIFVFSSRFKDGWEDALIAAGHPSVPVVTLTYPMTMGQAPNACFSVTKFMANTHRKIIQVGTWQRRSFGMASVCPGKETIPLGECISVRKATLTKHSFTNYLNRLKNAYAQVSATVEEKSFVAGALDFAQTAASAVLALPDMATGEFFKLLSDNILFLHLHDASVVNVLMDAFLRNCPVLVNRIGSAVELLGADYPLFYDDVSKAAEVLTMDNVRKAHACMMSRNKKRHDVANFVEAVAGSSIYRSLPMLSRTIIESRTQGGYVGALVGNQLPFAGTLSTERAMNPLIGPPGFVCTSQGSAIYRWPVGAYRDECEMALCSVRALEEAGKFEPVDHMDRFVRWLTESDTATCCQTTQTSVGRYLEQKLASPYNKANPYQGLSRCPHDVLAADAAPLTRVFPLILACTPRPGHARRVVQSYVELTHGSSECVEVAVIFCNVALGLFYGKRKDIVLAGEPTIDVQGLRNASANSLLVGDYMLKEPKQLAAKGSAARVLECALWALNKSTDFENGMDLVLHVDPAVNEASTLYGFLAGILYGLESVPSKWRGSGTWLQEVMSGVVRRSWEEA